MGWRLFVFSVVSLGCAGPPRHQPLARLAVEVADSAPLVVPGPAAEEPRAHRCGPEEATMGPVTLASSWAGGWRGCRTGPSPRGQFERVVQHHPSLRPCLERFRVTWLEATVHVAGSGRVASVTIDELEPADAAVEPCLRPVTHAALVPLGCRLEHRLHFAVR
ncbi:MAG: hypothetical protein JNJ54_31900 [Myxococcaceae bacterium]|nr:hypothetical protein [Myxococcaceae bacterium]